MIAIFPVYKTIAQMDLAVAGSIASVSALFGETAQVFFGNWSDQGYRRILIAAGVLATCAALGVVYCNTILFMYPLILVTYLGSAAFHPAAAGLVGGLSQKHKGICIGMFASGGAFGLAAGQLVFFEAYKRFGGFVVWLALPSLILALLIAFYSFPKIQVNAVRHISLRAMGQLFRMPALRTLYVVLSCNTTVYFGLLFLLPDLLVSQHYPIWICFGGGHLAMILGSAVMMIPSGYLADRYSAKFVMMTMMLASIGVLYAFLLAPPMVEMALLAVLFCLGTLLGVVHPVGVALANRLLPRNPGLVSAFAMGMVWCVAECFGPASSILTKLFPPDEAARDALLILATLNIVGIFAVFALPKEEVELVMVEL
jgi:MFS transporter, FSR family, fosmidomycin resistance protein